MYVTPATAGGAQTTVYGRTYSAPGGAVIQVPDSDGVILTANGWVSVPENNVLSDQGTTYTIPSSAAPAINCANGGVQQMIMTAATTVAAPINPAGPGDSLYLIFIQDSTGGRALSWNAAYRNAPTGLGGSATAGQRASFLFQYDGVSWQYLGGSTAFA